MSETVSERDLPAKRSTLFDWRIWAQPIFVIAIGSSIAGFLYSRRSHGDAFGAKQIDLGEFLFQPTIDVYVEIANPVARGVDLYLNADCDCVSLSSQRMRIDGGATAIFKAQLNLDVLSVANQAEWRVDKVIDAFVPQGSRRFPIHLFGKVIQPVRFPSDVTIEIDPSNKESMAQSVLGSVHRDVRITGCSASLVSGDEDLEGAEVSWSCDAQGAEEFLPLTLAMRFSSYAQVVGIDTISLRVRGVYRDSEQELLKLPVRLAHKPVAIVEPIFLGHVEIGTVQSITRNLQVLPNCQLELGLIESPSNAQVRLDESTRQIEIQFTTHVDGIFRDVIHIPYTARSDSDSSDEWSGHCDLVIMGNGCLK